MRNAKGQRLFPNSFAHHQTTLGQWLGDNSPYEIPAQLRDLRLDTEAGHDCWTLICEVNTMVRHLGIKPKTASKLHEKAVAKCLEYANGLDRYQALMAEGMAAVPGF